MISPVIFWLVATITVLPALGLLFARKPVYVAMAVVLVMVGLAIAYVTLDAPFLGVVQIVVYTGAVMMLFLFVLMLVGVDQRENMKETIKGQRWIAFALAIGLGALLITVLTRVTLSISGYPVSGEPATLAPLLFGKYVLVVETLGFVLIAAAIGALVLTHVPRMLPRRAQRETQASRVALGANPVNKPFSGVYARHNGLDTPALDAEGKPIEESVSRVLRARNQGRDQIEFADDLVVRRRELGAKGDEK